MTYWPKALPAIKIEVIIGDALVTKGNVLLLKYAQAPFGLDGEVIHRFEAAGRSIADKIPEPGNYRYLKSEGIAAAVNLLFLGVPPLGDFRYGEIREFGKRSMETLAKLDADIKVVLQTVHGPGYGLDEVEAFKSQLAGIVDAIGNNTYPARLQTIAFVERSVSRAERLKKVLGQLFPTGEIPAPETGARVMEESTVAALSTVGFSSENKKKAFVAMPFHEDLTDYYDYGITGAIKSAGYLCERADTEAFTGDVMDRVKEQIATAHFVIAMLTRANPNVYLEIGYAWGMKKRTVLVIDAAEKALFDVQGQRYIPYKSIKDLETKLTKELVELRL